MAAAPSTGVRFDLPTPDPSTQAFWDGTKEGRLPIRRCLECGKAHFYPRPFCPYCWSERVEWEDASGRATLYTYSIVYVNDLPPFPERVPYVAAVVDLEEGPRMMTNVVDCPFEDLRMGMDLEVTFRKETDDVTLPVFRPAGALAS
ncbi:MAG TPA: Zn-ribbon domain-containing OB-fold protein [Acidimicrobiales bacterium]|nr:Zn-ribbon domain-containing OB-fold protein [Acidimicrobiales bacterium]